MKHNIIKKIALNGLMGLGMALQSFAGHDQRIHQTSSALRFPAAGVNNIKIGMSVPKVSFLAHMENFKARILSSFPKPISSSLNEHQNAVSLVGLSLGVLSLGYLGVAGYNAYKKSQQKIKREQEDIRQGILRADFNIGEGISPAGQKAYAQYIEQYKNSPEYQKGSRQVQERKNLLLDTIQSAISISGKNFNINALLSDWDKQPNAFVGDATWTRLYDNYKKEFDNFITYEKDRVEVQKRKNLLSKMIKAAISIKGKDFSADRFVRLHDIQSSDCEGNATWTKLYTSCRAEYDSFIEKELQLVNAPR